MRSWSLSDRGLVRSENQDIVADCIDHDAGAAFLLVCDGMGGAKAGSLASQLTAKIYKDEVLQNITARSTPDGIAKICQMAVNAANKAVYDKSRMEESCRGMGTTLVSAFVLNKVAVIANIGDSRAYRLNKRGIELITRDHSVIEEMIRRGDITREEAQHTPGRNLITRAVGTTPRVTADIFTVPLDEDDYLLLCSDGLSNTVSEQEMLYEVLHGSGEDPHKRLLKLSLSRGASDNVSIVLFSMKSADKQED